ncbi:hypothetical protein [Paremcibacter congregatus]|uniref:hypothetical protein n=1 Tax=Paremcibacter congregatus TaxID=2043170 RepID=UPI003A8D75CA
MWPPSRKAQVSSLTAQRPEIELVGNLAGILNFVDPTKNTAADKSGRRQLPLVAGARGKLKLQTDLLPVLDPV